MPAEHVLTPDDKCPCGKPQTGSGYCSYECYSKHEPDPTPASMGGPLSEAEDMRREIVLREINQGALAGMSSEISEQAADLVLAALDRYDAWKAQQAGGDLLEVKAALRPGFAITLSQLIAEAQQDTHPLADAAGSTGPYVVQGCVVYGAQQLRDALRTVWRYTPGLLDELEAATARVGALEGQLATAQAELEQQRWCGEQLQMSIESCSGNHDDALGLDGGDPDA